MSAADLATYQFELFILILVRCSGLFLFAPFFSSEVWPAQVRVMGSLVLAWCVYLSVAYVPMGQHIGEIGMFPYMIFMELMIGFVIGFAAKLLLNGLLLAGSLMGDYIGFSMTSTIDPFSDAENNILAQMYYMFGVLLFVVSGGHHVLIRVLSFSFEVIPLGGWHMSDLSVNHMIELSNRMWVIGLELSGPLLISMIFVTVGLGLLAKAVPQMNIFAVGFLAKIFVGMIVLVFTLEVSIDYMQNLFTDLQFDLIDLVRETRPPG